MFTHCAKRISNGLLKRLKILRKVYTAAAFLENKFTHEVTKHGKKFIAFNAVYQKYGRKVYTIYRPM